MRHVVDHALTPAHEFGHESEWGDGKKRVAPNFVQFGGSNVKK
jgi:hypothetical protein